MKSGVALEVTFDQAIGMCMPIVSWVLVHPWLAIFLQTYDNHRQSDLYHFFVMCFAQKSRTILNSVMIMIKTEVVCWLSHPMLINSCSLFVSGTLWIL